jgi:hypothetical protein
MDGGGEMVTGKRSVLLEPPTNILSCPNNAPIIQWPCMYSTLRKRLFAFSEWMKLCRV